MMTVVSVSDAPNSGITYERKLMTLAKANARANINFMVQASLMIIIYDCQNISIV
jgi:hypothetical protein